MIQRFPFLRGSHGKHAYCDYFIYLIFYETYGLIFYNICRLCCVLYAGVFLAFQRKLHYHVGKEMFQLRIKQTKSRVLPGKVVGHEKSGEEKCLSIFIEVNIIRGEKSFNPIPARF